MTRGQESTQWVPLAGILARGSPAPWLLGEEGMLWVRAGMMRARGVLAQRISSYIEVLMFSFLIFYPDGFPRLRQ